MANVTPSTKNLKYVATCLHGSLLKLAYPNHSNNPKCLLYQNVSEVQRAIETIKEEEEVHPMVFSILEDIEELLKKSCRVRERANLQRKEEDPNQSKLF